MRSSRIVYYLLLAIVGISGCASTDRRYYSAAASSAPAPIARVLPLTAKPTSITTTPQPPTISETPKAVETVELPPMPKPQPAPFVAKSDRADSRDKPATSIARATPSVAPPPPSDNRLIELLEKDIDKAVEDLKSRGIEFESYGGDIETDDDGIFRGEESGNGPNIAWFKDPSGNVLSVIES